MNPSRQNLMYTEVVGDLRTLIIIKTVYCAYYNKPATRHHATAAKPPTTCAPAEDDHRSHPSSAHACSSSLRPTA